MIVSQMLSEVGNAEAVAPRLKQLKQSAQGMEAQFLKQMFQAMKKASPATDGDEGLGKDEYQDMFDDAVATAMSKHTSLGIANTVYRSLEPRAYREELARQNSIAQAAKAAANTTQTQVAASQGVAEEGKQ